MKWYELCSQECLGCFTISYHCGGHNTLLSSVQDLSLAASIKEKQQLHPPTSLQACMPFKYNVRRFTLPLYGVDWCCNSVTVNVNGGYGSRRSWCGRERSFARPNACELKQESVRFSLLRLSFNITLDSVSIQWRFNVNHTLVFLRVWSPLL